MLAVSAEHSEDITEPKLPSVECVHVIVVYICTEMAKKLHYGRSIREIGVEEECVWSGTVWCVIAFSLG